MSLLDDVSIVVTPNGYKAGELYAVIPVPTEGSEEVVNGDFATDSNWTKETGWTISGGTANYSGGTSNRNIRQAIGITNGKTYKIQYQVTAITSGEVACRFGGMSGVDEITATTTGTYVGYISANSSVNGELLFEDNDNNFVGSIDNVSVKEYTSADMDVTRATAATRVDENGLVNYAEVIGGELVDLTTGSTLDASSWSSVTTSGATYLAGGNNPSYYDTGFTVTSGLTYKLTFTISNYSGANSLGFSAAGGVSSSARLSGDGSYTEYFTASSSVNLLLFGLTSNTGVFSNVSVKEVTRDNVPRIDYTGGGCPHILAEPQRTNLYPYSSDFTQWDNQNTTISSNLVTSPDGTQNASEILETAANGNHGRHDTFNSVSGGATDYTVSMFVKKLNRRYFALQNWYGAGRGAIAFFDLDTGTLLYEFAEGTGYTVNNSKIEDYGNGWYKISTTFQIPSSAALYVGFVLADTEWTTGTSYGNPYTGDITKGAYIWGAQLEIGSYPTSYIPTSGSTVTRNQDIFTRDGIGSLINSTEGVLFVEVAALSDDSDSKRITISDGTLTNRITISIASNIISGFINVNNVTQYTFYESGITTTDFNKIAIKYKVNDFAIWINGVEYDVDTSGITFSADTLNTLNFSNATNLSNFFNGKVKQLQVYDTSLSDDQLLQLTGESGTDFYESYAEMASALTYTIQ